MHTKVAPGAPNTVPSSNPMTARVNQEAGLVALSRRRTNLRPASTTVAAVRRQHQAVVL
jgi:hypothetical protein